MKKLKEFLDPKLPKEKTEQIMKQLLHEKFDAELKTKYSEILEKEYAVSKEKIVKLDSTKSSNRKWVVLIISLLGVIGLAYLIFTSMHSNPQKDVQKYLAMNSMEYQGTMRDADVASNENRVAAFEAINQRDYAKAKVEFGKISPLSLEDQFYFSYAQLRTKEYQIAKQGFKALVDNATSDQSYLEESRMFYGLCLMATNDESLENYIEQLKIDSWSRKELESIR